MKIQNQRGFSPVEIILLILVLALLSLTGWTVWKSNKAVAPAADSASSEQTNQDKTTPTETTDPTKDWVLYTDRSGKYELKHPQSWVRASSLELCSLEIFLLGANSDSVGKCASESFGQMAITWRTDNLVCDPFGDTFTINSEEKLTVSGAAATKTTATAQDPQSDPMGAGPYPTGTKVVRYCIIKDNTVYSASYTQLSTYPDALSDFNTMVTKTFVIK